MRTKKKSFLGILLSLALMISMMPALSLTALAATGGNIPDTNLTWELSDTGTLTISGTGEMIDYGFKDPPWKSYKDNIKSIVINNGVTKIGNSAFSVSMNFCTGNLTQVTIPSSVTSVGTYVFNQCSGIENVSLGCSVIGEGMFQGCSGLTQITIPSNVTSIAKNAFNECSGLTQITIPSNVASIGNSAFFGCSGLTQITIPSNVTSIGPAAFYNCTNLEKVTFTPAEEGKTLEIGGSSFSDNAKVAYGTGNTRLYDGDTEIKANASLSSYNNKTLTWKQGTPATEYPLWVGGVRVTSANADNILGDNTASYDDSTKTLTLNGANITTGHGHDNYGIHYTGNEPLTIESQSGTDNTIIGAELFSRGIISERTAITFSGEGSLTTEGNYSGIEASGVTIDGSSVTATSNRCGIIPYGDVVIKSGDVTATGVTEYGFYNYNGNVIIEGGNVIAVGKVRGIYNTVKNAIAGTGWDNTEGTGDEHAIEVNTDPGQTLDYKKVQFPAEVEEVTVKFDSAGGSAVKEQTINKGAKATKPANPKKSGYTFDGWYNGKKAFDFNTAVNENITLTAHWKENVKPTPSKTSSAFVGKMKAGNKSMTISWNKVQGAAGYDVFFAPCNNHGKKIVCKKAKSMKGNKTFKWTKSGLKKGTSYKAYVKAYKMVNGKKTYIKTSPIMHAYTGNGTKKYTNAKSVTVKKAKVSLKKGKTFKIKTKVIKVNKKKKLMPKSHAPTLRYMTSDKKIATVSSKGKIKTKAKGKCYIYAYAHNGVSKKIKVTVK